jgi:hypothetical protein
LQPYLDPPGGCTTPQGAGFGFDSGIPPCARPIWRGLRDAATLLGAFRTGTDEQKFFGELDAEIQAGCESGQLGCTPRLPTQLQSLQLFSAGPFFDFMREWGIKTTLSTGYHDLPPASRSRVGIPAQRSTMSGIVRGIPATVPEAQDQMAAFESHGWPYRLLIAVYTPLLPCLLVAAIVGSLIPIVRPRWPQAALSVLSISLALGAVTRVAFVALLTIAEFGTNHIEVRYLLPAHALLLAFAVVGTSQLVDALRARLGTRPAGDHVAVTAPETVSAAD